MKKPVRRRGPLSPEKKAAMLAKRAAIGAAVRRPYPHARGLDLFHVTLPCARAVLAPRETLEMEDFPEWLR